MFDYIASKGIDILTYHQVEDLRKIKKFRQLDVYDTINTQDKQLSAPFVFIGA